MPEPASPTPRPVRPLEPRKGADSDKVLRERCQAEIVRMHAVWRCPARGFKTDCCGW